jgi:hypothetical protein
MSRPGRRALFYNIVLGICLACAGAGHMAAQSSSGAAKPGGSSNGSESTSVLQQQFFAAIRAGDAAKFLTYVPAGGLNVGPEAQHSTREDIEQQFHAHHGLYCKLFDSSCIQAPIKLDHSARACSYRELLTHSKKVRTAATATTRNNVDQAILVAEVKNDQCPADRLIDFIFNLEVGGWKLFSVP